MKTQDSTTLSDTLLTEEEAARELNCSPSFLAKSRMRGTGPVFIKIGRAVRYSRSALQQYRLSCTRTSTSQQQILGSTGVRKSRTGRPDADIKMIMNDRPSSSISVHRCT